MGMEKIRLSRRKKLNAIRKAAREALGASSGPEGMPAITEERVGSVMVSLLRRGHKHGPVGSLSLGN